MLMLGLGRGRWAVSQKHTLIQNDISHSPLFFDNYIKKIMLIFFQAFHDVAYCADSREELLEAINEFLVDTVVLPPGNWDRNVLLPILIAQSRAIAHRRKMAKAGKKLGTDYFALISCQETLGKHMVTCTVYFT